MSWLDRVIGFVRGAGANERAAKSAPTALAHALAGSDLAIGESRGARGRGRERRATCSSATERSLVGGDCNGDLETVRALAKGGALELRGDEVRSDHYGHTALTSEAFAHDDLARVLRGRGARRGAAPIARGPGLGAR